MTESNQTAKIAALELKNAALERKVELIIRSLDPILRTFKMAPLIDDQVAAINARQTDRTSPNAA
jgi:hypothetical protein